MPKRFTTTLLHKSPQDLQDGFLSMQNREDVSRFLDLMVKQLNFHLYVLPPEKRYKQFSIPKKTGGVRVISAPISPIKIIQRKLKQALEVIYLPKPATQGFVVGRSIVTNARLHKKRRFVLNLDLADFFPTIHFGRVRGMLMAKPFFLNNEVATILAQICCHDGVLPQGAPTSPVISNMICSRLDAKLQQIAKNNLCTYSRYADDISFSTNRSRFPAALAHLSGLGQVELGNELASVIEENGFQVNTAKTRLQVRQQRQQVTGLVVNKYPNIPRRYIKKIRAILHAWGKYSLASTANNYFTKYTQQKYSGLGASRPSFQKIIFGKIQYIGMVKGRTSPVYLGLLREFMRLAPEYVRYATKLSQAEVNKPYIYTEGKTDRKHLKAALKFFKSQGMYLSLELEFPQNDEDEGDTALLSRLHHTAENPEQQKRLHLFIFDRDKPQILGQIEANLDYKYWRNGVYSLALPIPNHRAGMKTVCIELYYSDADIVRSVRGGHRLYLSREFNPTSGFHEELDLVHKHIQSLRGELKIIDHEVLGRDGKNVALSKDAFAEHILNGTDGFQNMDFSGFKQLFEMILLISSDFRTENE